MGAASARRHAPAPRRLSSCRLQGGSVDPPNVGTVKTRTSVAVAGEHSRQRCVLTGVRVERDGLTIAIVTRTDLVVVFLDGELGAESRPLLERTLNGLAKQRFARVWVSLAGVTSIDTETIDVLVAARARAREQRREFIVRSPSAAVARSFAARPDCALLTS